MVLQSSMGRFKLDVRYGDRNTLPYYNGALDSALLGRVNVANEVTAGKVYTIATNGSLTVGLTNQGTVPYFGWSGLDENNYPDVRRDRGMPGFLDKPEDTTVVDENPAGLDFDVEGIGGPGSPGWPGIANRAIGANVAGGFATIQHIAAAELSSTAFLLDHSRNSLNAWVGDTGVVAANYTPGVKLTAVATGSGGVDTDTPTAVGALCPATPDDVVVGIVAPAGLFLGPEGYLTLAFTPTYMPNQQVIRLEAGALVSGAINVGPLA